MLTLANVQAGCGATSANAAKWLSFIQAACDAYQINTLPRLAAFLPTIGVESEYLTTAQEDLDYSAQGLANTWPRLFAINGAPNVIANQYARQPVKIANSPMPTRMATARPRVATDTTSGGRASFNLRALELLARAWERSSIFSTTRNCSRSRRTRR